MDFLIFDFNLKQKKTKIGIERNQFHFIFKEETIDDDDDDDDGTAVMQTRPKTKADRLICIHVGRDAFRSFVRSVVSSSAVFCFVFGVEMKKTKQTNQTTTI